MSKWTRCVACLIVLSVGLSATAAPPAPRKGVDTEKEVIGRYGSQHKRQITRIARGGDLDACLDYYIMFLNFAPNDRESLYGMVVAQAQKKKTKKIERAVQDLKRAVKAGLPLERFLAGPRDLLKPLTDSKVFQDFAKTHPVELLHGPMLGCLTDHGASFWVRTAHEVPVRVLVGDSGAMKDPIASSTVKTSKETDFTAVVQVEGLRPDTRYYYDVLVDGKQSLDNPKSFQTFPPSGERLKFTVVFGGGAGYNPPNERMWNTITHRNPLALLMLGDNVYIDTPEVPAVQRYCYYRRQSRPEWRALVASTPVYAIYDDHDFGTNDSWGGPEVEEPSWKRCVWKVFKENWVNPAYGGGEKLPGCWFQFSIGDVDFFMLDGRYYRDPKGSPPSMLGPKQLRWLKGALLESKGTFKVLASPVCWAYGTKLGSLDTWEGFKKERESILSFIEAHGIGGVVLLSADRHRSDVWKIKREGYDLHEFESSRLTNVHTHPLIQGSLFGYNEKCSFGLLSFDTTKGDPEVTYQIVNIDNQIVYTLTLRKSELTCPRGR